MILKDRQPFADSISSAHKIIPQYRFSSCDFARAEQFVAYDNEFAAFGRSRLPPGRYARDGFCAQRVGYLLNGLRVVLGETEAYSFSQVQRPGLATDWGHWVMILRMRGWADVDIEGNSIRFEGYAVEVRHEDQSRCGHLSGGESLFLYLPREKFVGIERLLDGLAQAANSVRAHPLLGCYLGAMGRVLVNSTEADAVSLADATLSMVRASISYSKDAIAEAEMPIMAARFEFARKYIDRNIDSPALSPDGIAAFLAVSRRQLYKIFDSHGGVYSYILTRRLEAAFREILASRGECSISRVAENYGFTDMARFSRAFRARFDCCPTELRVMARREVDRNSFLCWLRGDGPETDVA
ncbi:Helix-turn-helix, AraC domain-containing protein [Rhizobium sp. PDO1-076]|nr:Helix-turn-helix, AraC domain-containing protein [Rhizobium sp. PDO1-076]